MKKWEVLAGTHQDVNGVEFRAGDTIETDQDLGALFVGKFRQVVGDAITITTAAPIDMTTAFPGAFDMGYLVFALPGGLFNIFEKEDPAKPINPAPATVTEIMSFLQTEHISALPKPETDSAK